MNKSLEKLIEERRKEAESKNFVEKALRITDYLGHSKTNDSIKKNYYFNGLFEICSVQTIPESKYIKISSGWGTKIRYRDGIVFYGDGPAVHSYVPGEWEEEFEQLYRKAKKTKKRRKRTDFSLFNRNLIKARWGL